MSDQEFRQLVDRFLAEVSHELRTPLAVISGYAELLERRDDERVRREAPGHIRDAAERLAASVDAILMASALDSDSVVPMSQSVNLGDAVAAALERAEWCTNGRATASAARGEAWPVARADADLVVQVLYSLVRSACLAAPPATRVEIRVGEEDGRVAVSVEDDGPGLGEEELAQALERSAGGNSGRPTGVLGLYVARRLVELQGGTFEAGRSETGSAFRFTLPGAPT